LALIFRPSLKSKEPTMTLARNMLAAALLWTFASTSLAGNWEAFRGPAGTGISTETKAPLEWSRDKNIKWKVKLPAPGNSSPIVSGDKVFVTCATKQGHERSLFCYDRKDGKELWVQTVHFDGDEPTHGTSPYCGSSPAADGERVVVWHSSAGLHCYDYSGKQLWTRDLGTFRHIWGYGASPVFYGDSILINCGPGPRTFMIAVDRRTGETLWQTDEAGGDSGEEKPAAKESTDENAKKDDKKEDSKKTPAKKGSGRRAAWVGSWSTPLIAKVNGQDQVIVSFPHHVNAYDPKSGKILWTCDGLGDLVYTSPLVSDDIGIAMGGFHGPAIGFKLGGSGNVTAQNRLWLEKPQQPQRIGSGVIVGKHIYMANEQGTAQCIELETGKELWRERLPGGSIWGSLILAAGRLYVTTQKGTTLVFEPSPEKLKMLAENPLNEGSNSTPAFSDGQVFVRTFEHLYCIEAL
jgi:outer membrane protein assembly factor BamB